MQVIAAARHLHAFECHRGIGLNAGLLEVLRQRVEYGTLPLEHFYFGVFQGKPAGPIDFGEAFVLSGLRRPLHREHRTSDVVDIDYRISFHAPGDDCLPTWLSELAQRHELPVNVVAKLFARLPNGRVEIVLAVIDESFWDRSGTFLAQNGPPGCTRRTSTAPEVRRKRRRPALRTGMTRPVVHEYRQSSQMPQPSTSIQRLGR